MLSTYITPLDIELHLLDRVEGASLDAGIAFHALFRVDRKRRADDAGDGIRVAVARALAAPAADGGVHDQTFRKEVIIHDPDYTHLPADLQALSADCRAYAERKALKRAPNYFKLWMADSIDEEIEDINERLEKLVEEMSNTKSVHLLNALNNYPIIPVHAHLRPFRNCWLNMACGLLVPIGLFFYFWTLTLW